MTILPEFRIESYFSRWEFTARYLLGASDVESTALSELLALAEPSERMAWENLNLGYIETQGTPRLREALASTFDNIGPDEIICFAGAEEGIFAAMRAILDAGSHALIVTPNYQSAETLPGSLCETTGIPLDAHHGWDLDLDRVRAAIRPNTRLIYINFPHNPTGKLISRATYLELVELARRHGIYLFSDEVYRMMERDPARRLPQMADVYERGLSLNVTSKAYGFAGLRVGWIASKDKSLVGRMESVKHYLSICNAAPSELLAVIVLKAREQILARNRELVEENLERLDAFFAENTELFAWYRPDGGCIGYPRYKGAEGAERFAQRLLKEAGVMVVPGSMFRSDLNPTPENHFRIGFGRRDFADGLAVLRSYVENGR